ncbi:MAG: prepilin-type N-terminal cleavage/methylation domain-containing protein [Halobacteriovoraceae bacterium]|nr:prepilin-type N-terminal cleavage/methylation domain-containing protein [Halobacteriovoraceae bacterium]
MNNKGVTLLEMTITTALVGIVMFVAVSMYKNTFNLIRSVDTESTMDDLDYTLSIKIHRFKRSFDLQNYDSAYTYHIIPYKDGDSTFNFLHDPQNFRQYSDIAKVGYDFYGSGSPKTNPIVIAGVPETIADVINRLWPTKEEMKRRNLTRQQKRAIKQAQDPTINWYIFNPEIIPGTNIFMDSTTLKIDKDVNGETQEEFLISRCLKKSDYNTTTLSLSDAKTIIELPYRPYLMGTNNKRKFLVKCCPGGQMYAQCSDYNDYAPSIFYVVKKGINETISKYPGENELKFSYGAAFNTLLQNTNVGEAQSDPYIIRFAIMDNECSRDEILNSTSKSCNIENDKGRFLTAESPMVIYDPSDGGLQ